MVTNAKTKWKKTGMGNVILEAEWGRVSYNPSTGASHAGGFLTRLGNAFGGELVDGAETALYNEKTWMILTGDFRKEYEKAFPSLEKCIEVYERNKDKRNNWSTD